MKCSLGIAVLTLSVLSGCAVRRTPQAFRAIVNPSCLTAPIIMRDCDFASAPPRWRHVELRYRQGCAEIQVKKPDQSAR
jgi:hypothetical protein